MRKSSQHSQKQQKQPEIQNELAEEINGHYISNRYQENPIFPTPFNFDFHQIVQRGGLLDYQLYEHNFQIFNNQPPEQVNQHGGVYQFEIPQNKQQNFLQPNYIPAPSNMLSFIWGYNHPCEHIESEAKKQENNYPCQKQQAEWNSQIPFQGKDYLIEQEISHYISNPQLFQKGNCKLKSSVFKEQKIEQQQRQQNQLGNHQNFVKLESGVSPQKCSFKTQQKSPVKTGRQIRRQKVEKYLMKKNSRNFTKKITYICRKEVADKRIRLKGRFINYKQAVQQLKLDPNQKYQISFLKHLIKHIDESNSVTPRSTPNINPEQNFDQDKNCDGSPLLNIDDYGSKNSEQIGKANLFDKLKK